MRKSLEQECAQGERLRVALEHERTARDNLQKELRIESSRCEALLAQERGRLSELQRSLAAEEGRCLELSEALHHERLLTEQLSRRTQEARTPHSLGWELKGLRAALEAARQQEAQAQRRCEELRREKEVSAVWKSALEVLQTRSRELCGLEQERRSLRSCRQLEWLHPRLSELEDTRARGAGTRQRHVGTEKWQRDKERLVCASAGCQH